MWIDSRSIEDYRNYGEVMTFNTTHNTNRYKLVFDMFCRMNNHMKVVLFAYSVLSSKSVEFFVRLFKNFLKCMGEAARAIIIDQDPTTKIAIPEVFPNIFHYLCK